MEFAFPRIASLPVKIVSLLQFSLFGTTAFLALVAEKSKDLRLNCKQKICLLLHFEPVNNLIIPGVKKTFKGINK